MQLDIIAGCREFYMYSMLRVPSSHINAMQQSAGLQLKIMYSINTASLPVIFCGS